MTIETATYISDLNTSNPATGDYIYEGDDHVRLIKSTVKATFPNVTGAVTATHTKLNLAGTAGTWVLQATTTNSSTPSAIDFVNGTGGVVLDTSYDAHVLDFSGFAPSTGAQFYLQLSNDAGSTWTQLGAGTLAQALTISAGTTAGAVVSLSNTFKLSGGKNVTTGGSKASGSVMIVQNVSGGFVFMRSHLEHGPAASEEFCLTHGSNPTAAAALQSVITGIRLVWSTGTFATGGQVRLYSRKVS